MLPVNCGNKQSLIKDSAFRAHGNVYDDDLCVVHEGDGGRQAVSQAQSS